MRLTEATYICDLSFSYAKQTPQRLLPRMAPGVRHTRSTLTQLPNTVQGLSGYRYVSDKDCSYEEEPEDILATVMARSSTVGFCSHGHFLFSSTYHSQNRKLQIVPVSGLLLLLLLLFKGMD